MITPKDLAPFKDGSSNGFSLPIWKPQFYRDHLGSGRNTLIACVRGRVACLKTVVLFEDSEVLIKRPRHGAQTPSSLTFPLLGLGSYRGNSNNST